jgi:hypothetical protein
MIFLTDIEIQEALSSFLTHHWGDTEHKASLPPNLNVHRAFQRMCFETLSILIESASLF